MSLGQVLVLADEDDGRNPELFCLMLLQPIANDLGLADVGAGRVGLRVAANENIDSGLVEFLASEKLVQFGPGGAATALPVQFEISAVRRLFASPSGRKSLIVADVMGSKRPGIPVRSTCRNLPPRPAAAFSIIELSGARPSENQLRVRLFRIQL
jgi:hypothetical protein